MVKEIIKDEFFLKQKSKSCTKEDLYIANELLETIVEFKAFFRGPDAKAYIHHERSTFEKVNGHWYYIDGVFFET